MIAKTLLVLALVFGVLLAGLFFAHEPRTTEGRLVTSEHFVLERSGTQLLAETYSLFQLSTGGYRLASQGTLSVAGVSIGIAQEARYDAGYLPLSYELVATLPQEKQVITAGRSDGGFTMAVRTAAGTQTAEGEAGDDLALLDNNVIAHYAILLAAARAGEVGQTFSAAVPQALARVPSRLEPPSPARWRSGDRTYEGEKTTLHLGDTTIDLLSYQGRLAGLVNRTQGTVAYNDILFPSGLSVEESVERAPSLGIVERDVTFESGDVTLAGTLTVPGPQTASWCAVLFVAGSGPVDRDGNAPGLQMDAYRQLAEALAASGIASLRYDKRGVGASEGDLRTVSRAKLLEDVRSAWDAVGTQPELVGLPRVALGHSEGTYLVEELAAANPSVAGLVLLCGSPQSLAAVTRWQVETLLRQQGGADEQVEAALEQEDQFIAFVKASEGQWADYSPKALREALPWLTEAAAEQLKSSALGLAWLREHYNADPARTLAQIGCPVLIVSAGKDAQVPPADGEAAAQVLTSSGNKDVAAVLLDDLNHVLRHHPEEPNLVFQHLDEPVDPRVAATILAWARQEFGE